VIREQRWPWLIGRVELSNVLEPKARFGRLRGLASAALRDGRFGPHRTPTHARELKLLRRTVRLAHDTLVTRLERRWRLASMSDAARRERCGRRPAPE
jgi:hypothetical protein